MNVLKFGGTSVATADAIKQVAQIVLDRKDSIAVVVVSALGGITDLLLNAAQQAAAGNDYEPLLVEFEERHTSTIETLLPTNKTVLEQFKAAAGELKNLLKGITLIQEVSTKTLDQVLSFGERNSALIVSAYLATLSNGKATCVDTRSVIITDSRHGNALVDFKKTNQNILAEVQKKQRQCNSSHRIYC